MSSLQLLSQSCVQIQSHLHDKQFIDKLVEQARYVQGLFAYPSASVLNSTVYNIPYKKQWDICEDHVVASFKTLLSSSFFESASRAEEFLSLISSRNIAIAGGSVLAAYVNDHTQFGDIDIFHTPNEDTKKLQTFLQAQGFVVVDDAKPSVSSLVVQKAAQPNKRLFYSSSPAIQNYYTNIKHLNSVTTYVNPQQRQIQLIEVAYDNVRTHIRNFDLSCCQIFYQSGSIYIRKMYAGMTAQRCMVLCWNNDLMFDQRYANRIRKYRTRGWVPISDHLSHLKDCPSDIKVYELLDLHSSAQPRLISIDDLLDELKQTTEKAFIHGEAETKTVLTKWMNVIDNLKGNKQIGNPIKTQLTTIFERMCLILETPLQDSIRGASCQSLVQQMLELKDNRWLLLHMLKHQSLFQPCFTNEIVVKAEQAGIARDNLLLIKSMVLSNSSSTTTELGTQVMKVSPHVFSLIMNMLFVSMEPRLYLSQDLTKIGISTQKDRTSTDDVIQLYKDDNTTFTKQEAYVVLQLLVQARIRPQELPKWSSQFKAYFGDQTKALSLSSFLQLQMQPECGSFKITTNHKVPLASTRVICPSDNVLPSGSALQHILVVDANKDLSYKPFVEINCQTQPQPEACTVLDLLRSFIILKYVDQSSSQLFLQRVNYTGVHTFELDFDEYVINEERDVVDMVAF